MAEAARRRIVVAGSVNMDLMLRCPRLPQAGETVLGSGFETAPGGKGANQAVAAARLGAEVAFVGCIGNDRFGDAAASALQAEGIDTRHLRRIDGEATGVAMIVIDAAGENSIALAPGANASLGAGQLDAAEALFDSAALLLLQLESPLAAVHHATRLAQRHAVPVWLNPAPAQPLPIDMLRKIDLLVPNHIEAAALVGLPNDADAVRAAGALLRAGVRSVLITLGSQGVLWATAGGHRHHAASPATPVDTTGAGDTFVGALAAASTAGMPMEQAIGFAQRAAAFSVMRRGAQASMPRLSEL